MTQAVDQAAADGLAAKGAALQEFIMHHMTNSREWTLLPFLKIELPPYLTVHGVMLVIAAVLLLLTFGALYRKQDAVPHGLTNLLEMLVLFIRNQIAIQFLGEKDGRRMAPLFCSFFFFILCLNLMGLVPLFSAATANINVTAALASVTLAFMIFGGIYKNGPLGFFKAFAPRGVPWPVLVLLVPIEIIGLFIKSFALTIRLFANNLAGHIVIYALLGLLTMFGLWALPAVGLALGLYFLELLVCFLQAYIFTLLSAIFIGQVFQPEH